MPSINVSEADFNTVVGAALDARDAGDGESAAALDKLARKINAALSRGNQTLKALAYASGSQTEKVSWRDMPSVFDTETPTKEQKP